MGSGHLHHYFPTGGEREFAAGQEQFLLEGGMSQPNLVAGSGSLGREISSSSVQPHHAILGVVLVAVIGLWALDRFGFRFAVTAGRR